MLINLSVLVLSFVAMEFVAWFTHKYIMHGWLWGLHRDHHRKDHDHPLERNDLFFIVFGLPGALLIASGSPNLMTDLRFWIGLGITLYGAAYIFVHDIFIHQRIKIFRRTNNTYFKAMRKAHLIHHKHLNKEDGECFGFLWVPRKYLNEARREGMKQ